MCKLGSTLVVLIVQKYGIYGKIQLQMYFYSKGRFVLYNFSMANLLYFKYQVSFSVEYEMNQEEARIQTDVSLF